MHASTSQLTASDFKKLVSQWVGSNENFTQVSKKRLGEDFEDYFDGSETEPTFSLTYLDTALVKSLYSDIANMQKCTLRCFSCAKQKIEIVTTPDDKEIVGWEVK